MKKANMLSTYPKISTKNTFFKWVMDNLGCLMKKDFVILVPDGGLRLIAETFLLSFGWPRHGFKDLFYA